MLDRVLESLVFSLSLSLSLSLFIPFNAASISYITLLTTAATPIPVLVHPLPASRLRLLRVLTDDINFHAAAAAVAFGSIAPETGPLSAAEEKPLEGEREWE